jgi:hypothetical protein
MGHALTGYVTKPLHLLGVIDLDTPVELDYAQVEKI